MNIWIELRANLSLIGEGIGGLFAGMVAIATDILMEELFILMAVVAIASVGFVPGSYDVGLRVGICDRSAFGAGLSIVTRA